MRKFIIVAAVAACLGLGMGLVYPSSASAARGTGDLPRGFIAVSESSMSWAEAGTFCQQQGGRLPRINNSDLLSFEDIGGVSPGRRSAPSVDIHIDGLGALATRQANQVSVFLDNSSWPSFLPYGTSYWLGTERSGRQGMPFFLSGAHGLFTIGSKNQNSKYRVFCVSH